ncbi:hypothetical protein ACRE1S_03750 [Helicobacter himalayensis]|uniref:hypothetical protein n=1 Tax=Helicobacter himalayensis TaxID=1591088 RepID=UPI003D6EBABF
MRYLHLSADMESLEILQRNVRFLWVDSQIIKNDRVLKSHQEINVKYECECEADTSEESSQFWLCIFEFFSNVIEHNFYGLKLSTCAPHKYKRLKIQFHKFKILCKLHQNMLTLCFNPKIPPSKAFLRLFCNSNLYQKAPKSQKQKVRQSGRGMALIFRYSQPKLATMRHNELSLTIKAKK